MSEREARHSKAQIRRMADGRTIDLINRHAVESGAHGTRTEVTPDSPHTMPAIADPAGDSVFDGDFGLDTSYEILFVVADVDIPENTTDTASEEVASRVAYEGETYRLETVNSRFPAGFTLLGCVAGDEV